MGIAPSAGQSHTFTARLRLLAERTCTSGCAPPTELSILVIASPASPSILHKFRHTLRAVQLEIPYERSFFETMFSSPEYVVLAAYAWLPSSPGEAHLDDQLLRPAARDEPRSRGCETDADLRVPYGTTARGRSLGAADGAPLAPMPDAPLSSSVGHSESRTARTCEHAGTSTMSHRWQMVGAVTARADESDDWLYVSVLRWLLRRRVGYIMTLGVLPQHRRGGLGRRLLDMATTALALQHGCTSIALHCLQSNTAGRALYAAAGYRVVAQLPSHYYFHGAYHDGLHLRVDIAHAKSSRGACLCPCPCHAPASVTASCTPPPETHHVVVSSSSTPPSLPSRPAHVDEPCDACGCYAAGRAGVCRAAAAHKPGSFMATVSALCRGVRACLATVLRTLRSVLSIGGAHPSARARSRSGSDPEHAELIR